MTRLGSTLALILAVLTLGGVERAARSELATGCCKVGRSEVVVALASPSLAHAPGTEARIAAEQRAFRRELSTSLPAARVRWQYRLVSNGFAVVLPSAQLPRSATSWGAGRLRLRSLHPQLDRSPQQIGAAALWGQNLETAGQGMKIGVIDTGVDQAHPFFDPSGYSMPAGFPKGQVRFTNAKVIVARAFPPPRARNRNVGLAFDGDSSGHGTHVAGIAAGNARTPANGQTVSGVAPRAYIGNYRAWSGRTRA